MSASAVRAGRAYIELFTKDSSLSSGLLRAQKRVQTFGRSIVSIGAVFLGMGSVLASPFFMAIGAASDLEETMNKFNVVFGANAEQVKQWGDEYAGQIGRSKQQIADFMASNQDLFVPIGFEEGAATEMSKQVTQLSVDLASFNNLQDGDTLRDLQAALTGSGEVMKKYGVILSQTAVNQELMNQSIDPKKATEQQKVQARMTIIMAGTTAAQGDAIRSSGSWANQKKRLAATIKDAAAALGSKLLPILTPYLSKVGDVVAFIGDWIEKNEEAVRSVFNIIGIVLAVGAALTTAGALIFGIGAVFGGLASIVTVVGTALSAFVGMLAFLISPIGLTIAAVVGLGYAFFTMTDAGAQTLGWLGDQFNSLKDIATTAFGGIVAAIKSGDLKAAGKIALLGLKAVWIQITGQLSNIWSRLSATLTNATTQAWATIRTKFVELTSFLTATWATFTAGFQKSLAGAQNTIAQQVINVMAVFDDSINVADVQATLAEDHKRRTQDIDNQRNQTINNADNKAKEDIAAINSEAEKTIAARNAETDAKLAANKAQVAAARAELQKASDEAKLAALAATKAKEDAVGKSSPFGQATLGAVTGAANAKVAAKNSALDAGSSAGISAIISATTGRRPTEERILATLEQIQQTAQDQLDAADEANRKPPVTLSSEDA